MPRSQNHNNRGADEDDVVDVSGSGQPGPPPDEYTRLLPNRLDSNRGLLRPDDPAVTPYNLWTIRALRYLTIFFTLLTFAWWVLLLVSAFATPPGLHTRGSGFYAFGFASLTLAELAFTLVFFGVPAKSLRILAAVMAGILFVDMIIVLAVEKTRYEEGWVGTVSIIWTLLMTLWTLLVDRTVKWGKAEEEERLTGRAETRRTLFEWIEVLVSTVAYAIMAAAVLLITLTIILRALDARVAPPGKRYWVDGDKYQIHVYCHGNRTTTATGGGKGGNKVLPTVLLEGGEGPVEHTLWKVADDAVKNGTISRYCFADRPGIAWSDTAPSPFSVGFATDVLTEALAKAGEHGPWVLAGAGVGSLYTRVFSARNGADVQGLLLIDPLHERYLGQTGAAGRGFLLWLRGAISPLGLDRLPGAIFRGRTSRDRIYGRAANQDGKSILARLQESLVANSFTRREVESSREVQRKGTALAVVSSGDKVKGDEAWEEAQRDLTGLTGNLKGWDVVDGAPHEVWATLEGRAKIEKRLGELVRG